MRRTRICVHCVTCAYILNGRPLIAQLLDMHRVYATFYYLNDFTSHKVGQSCGGSNVVAVTLTPVEEKERQTDR